MKNKVNEEREEARKKLLDMFERNDKTVYTILRHVSRSGMLRIVDMYTVDDGRILNISWLAKHFLHHKYDANRRGFKVPGCGFDVGFDLVYTLSTALYGRENEGSYKLRHEWL